MLGVWKRQLNARATVPNIALRYAHCSRLVYRTEHDDRALALVGASVGIALVPALYDGPRIAKVRIPDFDPTLRGPYRGRDIAGLHPFNGQDVAVEVEGARSTGCPAWTHASIPPRSGRIFLNPACFRCCRLSGRNGGQFTISTAATRPSSDIRDRIALTP